MDTTSYLVDSPLKAEALRIMLNGVQHASIDTETNGLPWYDPEFRLVCVGISVHPGEAYVISVDHPESTTDAFYLYKVLEEFPDRGRDGFWVMQNGAFDLLALRAYDIDLTLDVWEDTMGIQYLLDVEARKGLEVLVQRWLGEAPWKDVDYKNIMEESLDTLLNLVGRDADMTLRLFDPMMNALEAQPRLLTLYDELLMPAMKTLAEMEWDGVPVDGNKLMDLEEFYESKVNDLIEGVRAYAGEPTLNPNSVLQLRKVLYGKMGLPVLGFTDGGAPSTDAATLQKLEKMHAIIPVIQELRAARKLLTASLTPWAEHSSHDGMLHPRYKPAFVKTGRLSSEMPNIQQVPRDPEIRSIFGGVEGHQVVELDYSQLELRIVAWLAGEEQMLDAFRNDKDLHQVTADLLGVDRYTGKTANFGLLYGAGARKLQEIAASDYGLELTQAEAEAIRTGWFEAYPAIADFHVLSISAARKDGGIHSALGRWRPLPDILNKDWKFKGGAERQAVNTPVQSVASDITLYKLSHLPAILEGTGIRPFITVHDSILLLVPWDNLGEVKGIQRWMERTDDIEQTFGVTIDVPLKVDVKVGPTWGEAK